MRNKFLTAIAESMRLDPSMMKQPGVSVIALERRAGSGAAVGYVLGDHFLVSADPEIESMLVAATAAMQPTMVAWQEVAAEIGGEDLGGARMQLFGSEPPEVPTLPDRFGFRSLDRDNAQDLALIQRLIDASSAEDLDEAEIEVDDLDPTIEVIVDAAGEIVSYSAGRPFDLAPAFGDIGIMTRPEHRGLGLGAAAVAAVCPQLRAAGLEPLYRCDDDNVGSVKLSTNLGFEIATQLVAYRFDTPNL